MSNTLEFHVHDDIELALKYYKIPIAIALLSDLYVLQEDRLVFLGRAKSVENFINNKH